MRFAKLQCFIRTRPEPTRHSNYGIIDIRDDPRLSDALVQLCSSFRKYFRSLGLRGSKWGLMKRRESRHHSNRHEGIMPVGAARSRRGIAYKERTEPMPARQKTRDLARSLVARETDASTTSLQAEPATVRVY